MSSSDLSRRRRKQNSVSGSSGTRRATATNTTVTKETGTSGAYNRNFAQHLVDHGVYPDGYEYPDGSSVPLPDDWEEFNRSMLEERASLSPSQFSEGKFREFRRADAAVFNEGDVMRKVVPLIQGTKWNERRVQRNVAFGNLAPLTDGTLKSAKPDLYYGERPDRVPREIRQNLSEYIVPSTSDNLPVAPNMFLEAKGPDGSAAVAQRQACYDGALGARGMQELLSYRQEEEEPICDNNIKAVSSIYHNGQLKMYTHHIAQPDGPGTRPEYYMNQVNTWGMTGNKESLKSGLAGFRNAVDWTDKRRNAAIAHANAAFDGSDGIAKENENEDVGEGEEEGEASGQEQPGSDCTEDDPLEAAATGHVHMSFMTNSLVSDSHHSSDADALAQQDSETSADELATFVPVPAKRATKSQIQPKPKRRARVTSSPSGSRQESA